MSWYSQRVERDLARWQAAGWVGDAGAASIKSDLASRTSTFGVAGIFAILGAVLFGFAIMTFVAAHWTTMSKLARLALILATLWGCYAAAAYLFARKDAFSTIYSSLQMPLGMCATTAASVKNITEFSRHSWRIPRHQKQKSSLETSGSIPSCPDDCPSTHAHDNLLRDRITTGRSPNSCSTSLCKRTSYCKGWKRVRSTHLYINLVVGPHTQVVYGNQKPASRQNHIFSMPITH